MCLASLNYEIRSSRKQTTAYGENGGMVKGYFTGGNISSEQQRQDFGRSF
jgi:hypothetical protein